MQKSSFKQNSGTYRMVSDYKTPNITLHAETNKPFGIWGPKHKDYLMKHKRVQFDTMLMTGTLWTRLAEVDKQAADMFWIVEHMKLNEGITGQLKADNQMEWVARTNNIEARARESVNYDLILTT